MNEPRKVPPPPRPPSIGGPRMVEQMVVADLSHSCAVTINEYLAKGWKVVNMVSPYRSGTHDHDGIVVFLLERGLTGSTGPTG